MNRRLKAFKVEVLINEQLRTKNNPGALRSKIYNYAVKYVFTHLLYDNTDNYLYCNLVLFLILTVLRSKKEHFTYFTLLSETLCIY